MPGPAVLETVRQHAEYLKDQMSYRDRLAHEMKNPVFDKLFAYNEAGDLYFLDTGKTIRELMETHGVPQDAPIQITNLLQVEERAAGLKKLVEDAAKNVGYPDGHMQVHFATKANLKAEIATAALRHVHIETSGEQDLENVQQMLDLGIITAETAPKIICNGMKGRGPTEFDRGYAKRIVDFHNQGMDITPVLVENELQTYLDRKDITGKLNVGLRLKFGKVDTDNELDTLRSRFGFDWEDIQPAADAIDSPDSPLNLTMLHAMVSAAETLEPKEFVKSLLFAAEKYAILKKEHPSLTHLNMGGGIPSMSSGYEYDAFFEKYFAGVKAICEEYGVDPPTIVFESGSFITDDCEHLVFEALDEVVNSDDNIPWINLNGVLASLPDIFIAEESFDFIAATNAKGQAHGVCFGDKTCDSFLVYPKKPKKGEKQKTILMPKNNDHLYVIVPSVGAYQDTISATGQELVLHCGNPEPVKVYIFRDENGEVVVEGTKRPSMKRMSQILGYTAENLHRLKINTQKKQ